MSKEKQLSLNLNDKPKHLAKKAYIKYSQDELLKMRDEALKEDFYHHTQTKHLNSEYVVHEILQKRYYISVDLIWLIVQGHYKRKYNTEKPTN